MSVQKSLRNDNFGMKIAILFDETNKKEIELLGKLTFAGTYPAEANELLISKLSGYFEISYIKDQKTLDNCSDLEYLVLRTLKVDRNIIANNKNLKLIQRWGSGFDTVDIGAASERNIPVLVATGVNSCAVAEHTILLILALYRHLVPLDKKLRNGIWDRTTFASDSYTINDKKAGLIGCGAIGKLVAQKLQALGAEVQYYDLLRMNPETEKKFGVNFLDLKSLLVTSDIISIHLPLTSETVNLITAAELKLMKRSAVIINTSRGGIINENDLADALQTGQILGAGLDSFEVEPYPENGRFTTLDNVVITPHIGGTVSDLVKPMAEKVADNVLRALMQKELNAGEFINLKECTYPSKH